MFSVEIKINGVLVSHIYGHNMLMRTHEDSYIYSYELYRPGKNTLSSGTVIHSREEGIEKLVQIILSKEINNE